MLLLTLFPWLAQTPEFTYSMDQANIKVFHKLPQPNSVLWTALSLSQTVSLILKHEVFLLCKWDKELPSAHHVQGTASLAAIPGVPCAHERQCWPPCPFPGGPGVWAFRCTACEGGSLAFPECKIALLCWKAGVTGTGLWRGCIGAPGRHTATGMLAPKSFTYKAF